MKGSPEITIARPSIQLISQLCENLKEEDQKMSGLFGFDSQFLALQHTLLNGWLLFIALIDGEASAALAVVPWNLLNNSPRAITGDGATVWLLCTPKVTKAPLGVLKASKQMLEVILTQYQYLEAYIDLSKPQYVKYAERLGFKRFGSDVKLSDTINLGTFRKDRP